MQRRWLKVVGLAAGVVVSGGVSWGLVAGLNRQQPPAEAGPNKDWAVSATPQPDGPSYAGEDGKTVLELLRSKALVTTKGTGTSTVVTSINGRKADAMNHEYWTFTVNDAPQQASPAVVRTTSGDRVQWLLDNY